MSTAEDGGATANGAFSSYSGGGAGGKFRKKPFRKQATPYDRPTTVLRGSSINNNNNNNSSNSSSWLKKLVVEPASKLISYGADRFFGSVFRARLPPLPPPQPREVDNVSDAVQGADLNMVQEVDLNRVQGADLNGQDGAQEPAGGDCSQLLNNSSSNTVFELEQLLKQKTFSRSEILHLTELLQSRAVERPDGDSSLKNEEAASDFGRHQQFASVLLEESSNGGIRSSAVMSTPIPKSKALEYGVDSPAELAKSYMGSMPSKVSPSVLGMRGQVARKDMRGDIPFFSKSPTTSLSKKTSTPLAAPENGFLTPRARGRSAIYSMARTPYSRVNPASNHKGSGINSNGYARLSMSSSSVDLVENDEKFESQQMTLKRRSSVLDEEVGSVGPMRRIRQKPNLLAPRIHHTAHGVGIGSHAKQKLVVENENENVSRISYAHVPSQSSAVASRILEHLEKLTPKEKVSESKIVAVREKSPLKLASTMLSGQTLRSTENVGSSKLQLDVQDDHKLGDKTNGNLVDSRDSSSQKQGKVEENGHREFVVPSGMWNPAMNNDSSPSLKASRPIIRSTDSVLTNGTSQPPQKKKSFRMTAQEDDDVHSNWLASRPSYEEKESMESPPKDSKSAPSEEPKVVKITTQLEDKSPSGLTSSKTELSRGAVTFGEGSSFSAFSALEETRAASKSAGFSLPAAPSDRPKETNDSPPLFSFSSKVVDKLPSKPFESVKNPEAKLDISNSLVNVTASTVSQTEVLASDKGFHVNPLTAGDINGKSDFAPSAALNCPLVSDPPPVSSTAASHNDVSNFAPAVASTTSAISSGSIFGLAAKSTDLSGPVFKFGASVDLPNAASPASTANVTEVADPNTKSKTDDGYGSSSSPHSNLAPFGAASSGSSTFGFGSSSIFANTTKSPVSGAVTASQGASVQLDSSAPAPLPSFSMSSSTPFGSSLSNSQVSNPNGIFGFSSAPTSDTSKLVPASGPSPSLFKFGASSTPASEGTAPNLSSGATPGMFGFGFGSGSSSSANAVNSSSGAATPQTVTNTTSSYSNGTCGIFNFGASSSAPSTISSNSAPNLFGSSWQNPNPPTTFGSTFASSSPATGFSFNASSTPSVSTNPVFSFTTASASVLSSPSQNLFGNAPSTAFAAVSPGSNDRMNAEDSMAEDPVQQSAPSVSVFGQPSLSPSPPGFTFGSTVASQGNPFPFGGQQNLQNPSPFQTSGSAEFNAGGGFSLGSGGVDKSGRKILRIGRSKNRKK
ncbi:hypothetical protein ACP275_06G082400 [Erythranthe tilingii]